MPLGSLRAAIIRLLRMVGQPIHKFHAPMLINGAADERALTKLADTKIYSPQRNRSTIECHLHTSTDVAK